MWHTKKLPHTVFQRVSHIPTAAVQSLNVEPIQWAKPFSKVARPKSTREADLEVHLDDVPFAEDTTIFTTVEKHEADEAGLRQVLSLWGEDLHADKTERIPLGTGAK